MKLVRIQSFKSWILLSRQQNILAELVPILTIVSGFTIELWHIVHTQWERFFFTSADMLTLSLVHQSLAVLREPFHWVFSSQIFLFPEGPIYALAALLTPNFRCALMLNALFNCLLLYILLRLIAANFSRTKQIARLYSLLASLFVLLLCCLEYRDQPSFATFFIATTTYYGVILAALSSLYISIKLLLLASGPGSKQGFRQWRLLAGSLVLIALLTSLSNPLYVLQFVAPLVAVCCLGLLLNFFSWRDCWLLAAPQLVGAAGGMLLRQLFLQSWFSPLGRVDQYLRFDQIGNAFRALKYAVLGMLHGNWQSQLELFLILSEMFVALVALLAFIHFATKPKKKPVRTADTFFIISLASITPPLVIVGSIITGNPLTRYMVPVVIFPLLVLMPLLRFGFFIKPAAAKTAAWFIAIIFVSVSAFAVLTRPVSSVASITTYYTSDERCLDSKLGHTSYTAGVAQYWRARGLQLNSRSNLKVLQVYGNLDKFTWLYNGADYSIYRPSFVIVDKTSPAFSDPEISLASNFAISSSHASAVLGQPSGIYDCPSFEIYLYPPGNPGNKILNDTIRNPLTGL